MLEKHAATRTVDFGPKGNYQGTGYNEVIVSLPEELAAVSVSALFYHRVDNTWFFPERNRATAARLRHMQRQFSIKYGAAAHVPPILLFDPCNRTAPFSAEESAHEPE